MSKIMFAEDAWVEYLYWQEKDKGTLKKPGWTVCCSTWFCYVIYLPHPYDRFLLRWPYDVVYCATV